MRLTCEVLLSFTCNVLFLVGSCLFLPIKSQQASVSFTFAPTTEVTESIRSEVVENIDVEQVMTSNVSLFEQLETNFTGALASDQSNRIKPHHTRLGASECFRGFHCEYCQALPVAQDDILQP